MIFILWALLSITSIGSIYGIIVSSSTTELVASITFLLLSMIGFIASIHYYMFGWFIEHSNGSGWLLTSPWLES